jgi:hypothetical protein
MSLAVFGQASAFPQSVNSGRLETLDEVVVVGRVPGPPLWKVSREGRALWILPLVDEAAQVICFETILARFEKDLDPVKRRANAWARGQVDDLINPAPIDSVHTPCLDPFTAVEQLPAMQRLVEEHPGLAPPDLEVLRQKSRQKWLSAAESALSRNTTTFAMLPVNDVLDSDGLIAQLEARGYSVEISAEPLEP